jgi:hypothetical protein
MVNPANYKNNRMKKDIICGDSPLVAYKTIIPGFVLTFALACFGFSPPARPVLSAPHASYPGNNSAESDDARFSLTI